MGTILSADSFLVLVVKQVDHRVDVPQVLYISSISASQELGMVFSYRTTFLMDLEILPIDD